MYEVRTWLVAFLLTCAIEVPIATLLLRRYGERLARTIALAFFANLATHPCVWFVFAAILHGAPYYAVAETFAFVVEAVFFAVAFPRAPLARAAAASLIANGTSFAVGLLIAPWLS